MIRATASKFAPWYVVPADNKWFSPEAVLGHVTTGVQKHYDMWTYLEEKREALEMWARKLHSLIAPGMNVVLIRQKQ
jgi:hypothetical protein